MKNFLALVHHYAMFNLSIQYYKITFLFSKITRTFTWDSNYTNFGIYETKF